MSTFRGCFLGITPEPVDSLQFDGSPSWQNQALRTLSVILPKAVEYRYLYRNLTIKMKKETRKESSIDGTAEPAPSSSRAILTGMC